MAARKLPAAWSRTVGASAAATENAASTKAVNPTRQRIIALLLETLEIEAYGRKQGARRSEVRQQISRVGAGQIAGRDRRPIVPVREVVHRQTPRHLLGQDARAVACTEVE